MNKGQILLSISAWSWLKGFFLYFGRKKGIEAKFYEKNDDYLAAYWNYINKVESKLKVLLNINKHIIIDTRFKFCKLIILMHLLIQVCESDVNINEIIFISNDTPEQLFVTMFLLRLWFKIKNQCLSSKIANNVIISKQNHD